MATVINNRSTIATDPIRNFRFLVRFVPQTTVSTGAAGGSVATSTWADALSSVKFGFTAVSGMAVTTDSIPYREGGYNTTVHQIPGQTSFAPLTLSRGVILGSDQNWKWMRELFQTVQGATGRAAADNFRCDIVIDVLTHPLSTSVSGLNEIASSASSGTQQDHVSMRFKVYNAWITALAYSDLSAGDNAILVEQMTLVHEGFETSWGSDLTDAGSAKDFDK